MGNPACDALPKGETVGRHLAEPARVAIGLIAYNDEEHLEEAISSILAQQYTCFRLVISDDCSTDHTGDIARRCVTTDSRVAYHRNQQRVRMARNYRLAFRLAARDAQYFAWASGHDRHQPDWLGKMVRALDTTPNAVMAYSLTRRIDKAGRCTDVPSPRYDTAGLDARGRIDSFADPQRSTGFGNMIYGLFRTDALRKAGVFPIHLFPDVLLLAELTAYGCFVQLEEHLWCRRFHTPFSPAVLQRQMRKVLARPTLYTRWPWPLVHCGILLYRLVVRARAGTWEDRALGVRLCRAYWRRFRHKMRTSYGPA